MGDRNPLTHPPPPRWRKGVGVGLVSPKAMNNKAQGRFSAPWGRDRCPQRNLNEVLQRMCAIPLHTMECRFVVQPLCGWVELAPPRQRVPICDLRSSSSDLHRRARALPLPTSVSASASRSPISDYPTPSSALHRRARALPLLDLRERSHLRSSPEGSRPSASISELPAPISPSAPL